jgi:uncharacterized membrane protein YkvA (DUF1232 family)
VERSTDEGPGQEFIRKGAERITEDDLRRLEEAEEELRRRVDRPGPIGHLVSDVNLMVDLVKDYRAGRYREVPWWALSAIAFCLAYVLSPIDALPDPLPVVGRIDDAAVLGLSLLLVDQELQRYKGWRYEQLRGPVDPRGNY